MERVPGRNSVQESQRETAGHVVQLGIGQLANLESVHVQSLSFRLRCVTILLCRTVVPYVAHTRAKDCDAAHTGRISLA